MMHSQCSLDWDPRFCNTPWFSQPRLNQNPGLMPGVGYGSRMSLYLVWVLLFSTVEPIELGGGGMILYICSMIGSLDDHRDTGVPCHILLSSDTTKIPKMDK